MGKVARQTKAQMVNVSRSCKSRGLWNERLVSYLGRPYPHFIDMVEKGLGRESDDVIVGLITEGLKRFIVQIGIKRIIRKPEIGWIRKVGA